MTDIRRILLIGHTHHDVGYTNSPRVIDRMHARIVDEVLDLCDVHAAPGPDQFRWTFEVARPVLNFLARADAADIVRLRDLVAEGRISVTGGYLNMTQLPDAAELDTAYDRLRQIREVGIPVRTEQHGDVNGIAWGAVPAMRRAGIGRLLMALNPDHGRPPLPQPSGFRWAGPDGEPVFVWLSTHYGFGEEWGIVDGDVELAERSILDFIDRLAARDDYPYDTALVHAANDNRYPTALFLDVVRHWNARHPDVPMRTATVDDALDVLGAQADMTEVPVLSGEWSDWWSHGHGSTAREVAVYRRARSLALAAQTTLGLSMLRGEGAPALSSVLGFRRGPVRVRSDEETLTDLAEVDDELLLFGEHTWGSWETYSKPHSTFSHSHWNAKAGFAYGAYDLARDLAVEGAFRLVASGAPDDGGEEVDRAILVVNPTESIRTEPITVEVDGSRLHTTIARDVPAFGTTVLSIGDPERSAGSGRSIECGSFRVEVDPGRGGVVSLVDTRSGRGLVDGDAGHGLGAVVTEQVEPGSRHPMLTVDPKHFRPEDPGPDFVRTAATGTDAPAISETDEYTAITWRTAAATIPEIETTLRLYRDLDAIDLDVRIEKPEDFAPESVFVAFPFAVTDPRFLLETAGAVYEAETEQLPDTSKDWYSIQHAIGVGGTGGGVLWGTRDVPLVQLGGFHTGQWARRLEASAGHINSWVMNNLHFTNFQARQSGTRTFRYRFTPVTADAVTHASVRRYGRDIGHPLVSRQYAGPVRLTGSSGLSVEPADGVLTEVRPVDGGRVRVRLRNVTAEPVTARVAWAGGGTPTGTDVALSPYATADAYLPAG